MFETEFTFTKSASDFSVFKSPKFPWKKSHAFHGNNCAAAMMASVPTIPGTWTRCRVGTFGASLTSDLARPCQRQVPRCGVSGGNKVGRPWPRPQGVSLEIWPGLKSGGPGIAVITLPCTRPFGPLRSLYNEVMGPL